MRLTFLLTVLLALLAGAVSSAGAQPVYKCKSSRGTVVYSHEPCVGALVVDTTPTQGLDKSSGQSRKGADVRKSETNRAMAKALEPIFGETAEEYELRHKRFKLPPKQRAECATLDKRLPAEEAAVRDAGKGEVARAEGALFESRKRYREAGC
jgi:hypothetical protein